jgi:hypothetical protein
MQYLKEAKTKFDVARAMPGAIKSLMTYDPKKDKPAHYPGHNYTGPGTPLEDNLLFNIEPVNAIDAAARQHDVDYFYIAQRLHLGRITRQQAIKDTREADLKLLHSATAAEGIIDGSQRAVMTIMQAKMKLEDLGLMNPLKFVVPSPEPPVNPKAVWRVLPKFELYSMGNFDELGKVLGDRFQIAALNHVGTQILPPGITKWFSEFREVFNALKPLLARNDATRGLVQKLEDPTAQMSAVRAIAGALPPDVKRLMQQQMQQQLLSSMMRMGHSAGEYEEEEPAKRRRKRK